MMQYRFVSFLLRMAHDSSLRQTGAEVPKEESVEALLMKQVDQLANQIIKTKEEAVASPQNASAASFTPRFMRAVQMGHAPVVPAGGGVAF